MSKIAGPVWGALLCLAGLSACATGEADTEGEVSASETALCSNSEGTNYMLASLAAATAKELRRWQPGVDFRITRRCGYVDSSGYCHEIVELSPTGKARCYDGQCRNVQSILDFQKKEANGSIRFPGGIVFKNDVFASRLVTNLRRQITCNSQPDNHSDANCPVEAHELAFSSATPGTCDTDYWFHAYKAGTTQPLNYPRQLKNQLLMFGYLDSPASNPYLAFDVQGDDVKIDPGPGLVSGDPLLSGACPVLRINGRYSEWDLSYQCCTFENRTGRFGRSAFSYNYFLCHR